MFGLSLYLNRPNYTPMFKLIPIAFLCAYATMVYAQSTPATPALTAEFGKVSQADLELKSCDFEKDANAMVLLDMADAYYLEGAVVDYFQRVKIFNEKGNSVANVHLQYVSIYNYEYITGLEAETINLVNGKPEITKVDKKQIFTKRVDAFRTELAFTFPNIKPGSIIEYKYRLNTRLFNIPNWYFQYSLPIPERYNQLTTSVPDRIYYKVQLHTTQPFEKDIATGAAGNSKHIYTMVNVPSFNSEPFMSSWRDNVQSFYFQITGVFGDGNYINLFDSWDKVGKYLIDNKYFGYEMNTHLSGQTDILKSAKSLATNDQKIAYIFNKVKNDLKSNGIDTWYTQEGVSSTWQSKTGTATEINLILYNLLTSAGIECYPFLLSTHKNGKINPAYPNTDQFNRAVVYVPGKNDNNYILDASSKYNLYNEIPEDLLNSFGLIVDKEHSLYKTIFIENQKPVKDVVFVNAEIKPDGGMEGIAQKSSFSYAKNRVVERYQRDGAEKYKEYLKSGDNNLKIVNLKLENIDVDSLPVNQKINFKLTPAEAGSDYIYINPAIFSDLKRNPFLAEKRLTDIDFECLNSYSIVGIYKLPAGYKTEALPKSVSMVMPDKSISFQRIVSQEDGMLSVRYVIDYQKSMFLKEDYPEFREFYKKMFEMLNEQIVLKKS